MPELEHDNPHQTEAEVQENDTPKKPRSASLDPGHCETRLAAKVIARAAVGWCVPVALVILAPGGWLKLALVLGWVGVWESASKALDGVRVKHGMLPMADAVAVAVTGHIDARRARPS